MSQVQAVTFDFGNTLIRLGDREHHEILQRFHAFVRQQVAECSLDSMVDLYTRIMNEQYRIYRPQAIENDMHERLEFLFWKLQGEPPTPELLQAGIEAHCAAVVASLTAPPMLKPLLAQLSQRYQLGVISNYPYYEAIPAVLEAVGVRQYFGSIVVSAAVGTYKPERRLFDVAADELGVSLADVLHVGDDIAADVVGALSAGAHAAYLREFIGGGHGQFLRYDDAKLPDGAHVLDALTDLPHLLADMECAGAVAGEGSA